MSAAPFGKSAHVLRKPDRPRRRKQAAVAAVEYSPGYFTALIRQHDWPPSFRPAVVSDSDLYARRAAYARQAQANREAGKGHAGMSLDLPGAAEYVKRWNFATLKARA